MMERRRRFRLAQGTAAGLRVVLRRPAPGGGGGRTEVLPPPLVHPFPDSA